MTDFTTEPLSILNSTMQSVKDGVASFTDYATTSFLGNYITTEELDQLNAALDSINGQTV